ncbi:UNVERIFIED_CONTAM: Ankyrin repeat domain-containing protein, chloroplastic [Sesamum radiatum]|uniref:Ankyrin repeat domain-containing protein, chloroplastic n=1 Tax=Sesamum radiatum TaxID=300843 RepID=A0AAW2VPH9_SESRA
MSSSAPSPPTILRRTHTSVIFSLLPTSSLSLPAPSHIGFARLTPANLVKSSNSPQFSSQPLYDAVPHPQPEEEEEEEPAIGDCLVFEEGVFNDPFLQNTWNFRSDESQLSKPNNNKDKGTTISPESLIPEDWVHVQRELNITKKERRKLSQQLEYGRRVEKRRQALMPLNSGEYEKFKNEKLQKLKPIVLDDPEPKYLDENDKHEKDDDDKNGEGIRGRVAPRNPRLAVYGGGLEDISALFSCGSYDPGAADKPQGIFTSGKWHPLHTLAASGQFYLVNALLKHNLDINVPDKDGLTAIHKAILGKKQAIFNFLLRESANPFVRDSDGATLMHYAVLTASSHMIKILLLYNVDLNLQDNDGWTPLHLAVQSRRTDVVRLLLIKGADKTLKNRLQSANSRVLVDTGNYKKKMRWHILSGVSCWMNDVLVTSRRIYYSSFRILLSVKFSILVEQVSLQMFTHTVMRLSVCIAFCGIPEVRLLHYLSYFMRFVTEIYKTMSKMAVARIKLLRNKREVVIKQMRRDIAMLLESGQDSTARIRVEHVIREQNIMAANELIELFCELVVARLSIIAKQRECPADLKEGIASLIFAAPRCSDIPELLSIRDVFQKKYGKDFVSAATDLRPNAGVNRMLIEKLSVKTPSGEIKLKVLKEIAKEYQFKVTSLPLKSEPKQSPVPDIASNRVNYTDLP